MMSPFDYVSVLLSIVLSLALAHILTGVARLIEQGVTRFSIPLAGWMGFMALLSVDYWTSLWHAHEQREWSLIFILFLLSFAALLYILCRLIVPEPSDDRPIDMAAFFDANRRKFISCWVLYCLMGEATNLALPGFGDWTLACIAVGYLLVAGAAWTWKSTRVQIAAIATNYVLFLIYAWIYLPGL